jgi:alpha-tubulin suppressor-like RCC1 family protein
MADGGVRCWGSSLGSGIVGDGADNTIRLLSTAVVGLPPATALAVGWSHTCVIAIDAGTWCWGDNLWTQLGVDRSAVSHSSVPLFVAGLEPVQQIVAGYDFTCALTTAGATKCWGHTLSIGIADGGDYLPVPTTRPGLETSCTSVAAGFTHACVTMSDGGVRCFGVQSAGDLGNGVSSLDSSPPVGVVGLSGPAVQLTVGDGYSCAILTSGEVQCWGDNSDGELGLSDAGPFALFPANAEGLDSGVVALQCGYRDTCAVSAPGDLLCWGSNEFFALTAAAVTSRSYPGKIPGLAGPAIGVSKTIEHTCAVLDGGAIMCWGSNQYGALGDGTQDDRPYPVFVLEGP